MAEKEKDYLGAPVAEHMHQKEGTLGLFCFQAL